MIFNRQILWIMMFQPLQSMVNTIVFITFHFLHIFVILMTSGSSWNLILVTFEGLGRPFWWFFRVLETHWNFIDFQDHPELRPRTWLRVNCHSRGYSILPDCWPAGHQIADTSLADGILKGTEDWVLKSFSSQPGGPWQAGAGGYIYRERENM